MIQGKIGTILWLFQITICSQDLFCFMWPWLDCFRLYKLGMVKVCACQVFLVYFMYIFNISTDFFFSGFLQNQWHTGFHENGIEYILELLTNMHPFPFVAIIV